MSPQRVKLVYRPCAGCVSCHVLMLSLDLALVDLYDNLWHNQIILSVAAADDIAGLSGWHPDNRRRCRTGYRAFHRHAGLALRQHHRRAMRISSRR